MKNNTIFFLTIPLYGHVFPVLDVINKIAHVMGLKTVAEHVESKVTNEIIRKTKVDYIEGNYTAKALPLEEIIN